MVVTAICVHQPMSDWSSRAEAKTPRMADCGQASMWALQVHVRAKPLVFPKVPVDQHTRRDIRPAPRDAKEHVFVRRLTDLVYACATDMHGFCIQRGPGGCVFTSSRPSRLEMTLKPQKTWLWWIWTRPAR